MLPRAFCPAAEPVPVAFWSADVPDCVLVAFWSAELPVLVAFWSAAALPCELVALWSEVEPALELVAFWSGGVVCEPTALPVPVELLGVLDAALPVVPPVVPGSVPGVGGVLVAGVWLVTGGGVPAGCWPLMLLV